MPHHPSADPFPISIPIPIPVPIPIPIPNQVREGASLAASGLYGSERVMLVSPQPAGASRWPRPELVFGLGLRLGSGLGLANPNQPAGGRWPRP